MVEMIIDFGKNMSEMQIAEREAVEMAKVVPAK